MEVNEDKRISAKIKYVDQTKPEQREYKIIHKFTFEEFSL